MTAEEGHSQKNGKGECDIVCPVLNMKSQLYGKLNKTFMHAKRKRKICFNYCRVFNHIKNSCIFCPIFDVYKSIVKLTCGILPEG